MIRPDLDTLPTYVQGAQASVSAQPPLKLSSNEAAEGPLPSVVAAMTEAAANAHRYPDMGAWELRAALAAKLNTTTDNVAVGAGSSALCQQLAQVTCTAGDEVLFAWRSFEAYPIFAQVAGATPVMVPLTEDGQHDLDAMADAITPSTRLIFVCSPNNPSGRVVDKHKFAAFMDRVPSDVLVALDEAYVEYNRDPNAVRGEELDYPNVVCLRTFSKAYGLAGVRVGYAFGPTRIIEALNKVAIPFSVSAVAQHAALASLNAEEELARRVEATVDVRDEVADHIGAQRSQGNFVWLPGPGAHELAERLREHNVLVRPFDEGLRVTVTNRVEAEAFLKAWDSL